MNDAARAGAELAAEPVPAGDDRALEESHRGALALLFQRDAPLERADAVQLRVRLGASLSCRLAKRRRACRPPRPTPSITAAPTMPGSRNSSRALPPRPTRPRAASRARRRERSTRTMYSSADPAGARRHRRCALAAASISTVPRPKPNIAGTPGELGCARERAESVALDLRDRARGSPVRAKSPGRAAIVSQRDVFISSPPSASSCASASIGIDGAAQHAGPHAEVLGIDDAGPRLANRLASEFRRERDRAPGARWRPAAVASRPRGTRSRCLISRMSASAAARSRAFRTQSTSDLMREAVVSPGGYVTCAMGDVPQ